MSTLIDLEWDSYIFGRKTGKIDDYRQPPTGDQLSAYQCVHVRIPQDEVNFVFHYQKLGFRYITLDFSLEKKPTYSETKSTTDGYNICLIEKTQPICKVSGFQVLGSRLAIDPELNQYLKKDFWDNMINEHCCNFADFALYAVDKFNQMIGFISCFNQTNSIKMILVAVHPSSMGIGVGSNLIQALESKALSEKKILVTDVVANNIKAINFYLKNGFVFKKADIVMHYSNLVIN